MMGVWAIEDTNGAQSRLVAGETLSGGGLEPGLPGS